MSSMVDSTFSKLSDDIILQILFSLESDPRNWARLCCVSTKFNTLITSICCKSKCMSSSFHQSVPSDLVSLSTVCGGWASLYKVAVCCPGVFHAGVLLDNSDFGLQRELGPSQDYYTKKEQHAESSSACYSSTSGLTRLASQRGGDDNDDDNNDDTCVHEYGGWSLYDDLYFDTIYDNSEASTPVTATTVQCISAEAAGCEEGDMCAVLPLTATTSQNEVGFGESRVYAALPTRVTLTQNIPTETECGEGEMSQVATTHHALTGTRSGEDRMYATLPLPKSELESEPKRRKVSRIMRSHLASGGWNLSREQGKKLLGSRFRDDCLYISEWPGCIHIEEKRSYRLFRGVFNNFKGSRVWRTINDGSRSKIELNCAFCKCKETWDLHSAFCLKRGFGFHDDGEPVVRAYVCENGHVSGAWTDLPLYA